MYARVRYERRELKRFLIVLLSFYTFSLVDVVRTHGTVARYRNRVIKLIDGHFGRSVCATRTNFTTNCQFTAGARTKCERCKYRPRIRTGVFRFHNRKHNENTAENNYENCLKFVFASTCTIGNNVDGFIERKRARRFQGIFTTLLGNRKSPDTRGSLVGSALLDKLASA